MKDFTLNNGFYTYFGSKVDVKVDAKNFTILINGDVVGKGETLSCSFDLARTVYRYA